MGQVVRHKIRQNSHAIQILRDTGEVNENASNILAVSGVQAVDWRPFSSSSILKAGFESTVNVLCVVLLVIVSETI